MSWGNDDGQRAAFDQDRQALADLLAARGHMRQPQWSPPPSTQQFGRATMSCPWVLPVPPALYDRARVRLRTVVGEACTDIVGDECYRGLQFTVRRSPVRANLAEEIIAAFTGPRWVNSETL